MVPEKILFGSGYEQTGLAGIDDLLGLGWQSMSLKSHASSAYGEVFSYCLPPKGDLRGALDVDAPSTASGFAPAGLLPTWDVSTFYMVMLTGISIGGQPVGGVPTSMFVGRRDVGPGGARGFPSTGCLAFAPNGRDGEAAILGNVQQRCVSTDPPSGSCLAPANRFIYPSGSCSDRKSVLTVLKHTPRLGMHVAADAPPAAVDALLAGAGDHAKVGEDL
jgi:hypothetical protein